jgi:predicted aspartyl protease
VSRRAIIGLLAAAATAAGCAQARPVRPTVHAGSMRPPVTALTRPPKAPGFSLPMRVVNSNGGTLVFVPVRVNGNGPYEFVLDTGSSNSSVDRSLVHKLGLPRTGRQHRVQGATGSGVVPVVRVQKWMLGNVPLRGTTMSVVDLGIGVAGLLGSDELRRFGSVTLDFDHNRVLFRNR